jgi:hypothetical protein
MPPDAGPPQAPIERKPQITRQAGVAHVRTVMSKASAAPRSSYIHLQQVLAGASKKKSLLVGLRVHVDVYVEVRAHSVKKLVDVGARKAFGTDELPSAAHIGNVFGTVAL